jgi:hypothetical protein
MYVNPHNAILLHVFSNLQQTLQVSSNCGTHIITANEVNLPVSAGFGRIRANKAVGSGNPLELSKRKLFLMVESFGMVLGHSEARVLLSGEIYKETRELSLRHHAE